MKKVSLIILLAFVCLAQLLAKDYPYLVYGEDGIYTYNIEDKKFCLKEFFKYKEKQRPYYRYFSDKDSVVMYDSEFDNYHCMFYRLNRQTHEFEEIYKIDRYNPYKECLVSVKDFIYMVERNLTKDTDSYWLTKRSFGSPDVIEKIELEIPDTEHYKKTGVKDEVVDECFLFKEHLIVPRFRWSNEYCILAKKTGRCLLFGKGEILFNRNSKSIFILENERELYSINMDDSGCAKKRVNTFVSEKEIILDITDYGDFCILKTGVWKTNFEPFTRIIFDHKRKLVTTEYYCSKMGDVLVNEGKMNKLKN